MFARDDVKTLLGEQANEPELQALASRGDLKRYRLLHFAAHCQSNSSAAMDSALILAPAPGRSADLSAALDADGRITAQQIVNTWDLDADLVVLSACESGLGKYAGGEGYLGFTQALFVKGARSVVLSLWKVDDRATALLMTRFYRNLLGEGPGPSAAMPKAEALDAAKRWLRGLSAAEVSTATEALSRGEIVAIKGKPVEVGDRPFEHPKFWAGFILVGDPD
jgi:CHAT domain-containing protein